MQIDANIMKNLLISQKSSTFAANSYSLMKVVVLDGYAANPGDLSWAEWEAMDIELTVYDRTAPEDTLTRCEGATCVLTNKVVISRSLMEQLPTLRYIGVLATGYNVVDIQAAHEHGIVVTNIPAYSTQSVAQMVFAHLLHITNNVAGHAAAVSAGAWQQSADFCFWLTEQQELAGRTIGIVGLGNTGTATARIALSMGMQVLAYTSKTDTQLRDLFGDAPISSTDQIDHLFATADVVSLHCPLTDKTRHIVCEHTLSLMKPKSILINTGRGPLIDEQALANALQDGRIQAAGIDVLTEEAPRHGSPLIGLKNCFITPHIAWATTAARQRLMHIAVANLQHFIAGTPVNTI